MIVISLMDTLFVAIHSCVIYRFESPFELVAADREKKKHTKIENEDCVRAECDCRESNAENLLIILHFMQNQHEPNRTKRRAPVHLCDQKKEAFNTCRKNWFSLNSTFGSCVVLVISVLVLCVCAWARSIVCLLLCLPISYYFICFYFWICTQKNEHKPRKINRIQS